MSAYPIHVIMVTALIMKVAINVYAQKVSPEFNVMKVIS